MGESAAAGLRAAWLRLSPNRRGALWMIGAATGFTLNTALVKALGAADFHPFQLAFLRTGIALLALLPLVWRAGPRLLYSRRPGLHLLRGIFGGAAVVAGFTGLTLIPLADFTALSFTTPLFIILLAVLLLGETVRWRRWSATVVGFLGVLVMLRPSAGGFVGSFDPGTLNLGVLCALGMAFGIAVASTLVKRLPPEESALSLLFWFSFSATLLIAPLAVFTWRAPSPGEWLWLVAMGVLGAGAQFLIIRAYKVGEATFVAPFDYSKLLLAGLIGYLAFDELPDLWTLAGAAIIVGATLYIARREAAVGHPPPAPVEPPG
ncbi:MAG: DMT family transporter [Kiloniellales bacterium]